MAKYQKQVQENKYTISPSYNLSDNLIETDINFNLPELTNNINMAILGMFNDAGNKRLSTMCVGVKFDSNGIPINTFSIVFVLIQLFITHQHHYLPQTTEIFRIA